jgi:hypothetical protein
MNRCFLIRQMSLAVTTLSILGLGCSAIAAPPVPFKGRANLVVTGQEFLPPASVRLTGSATGQATHLGRFTRTETIVVNLQTFTFTGTLEFIAADGDRLTADVAGHFTSPNLDAAEGTYVFTGRTGRFQNALGQAAFEAKADGASFDVKFNGTIQY